MKKKISFNYFLFTIIICMTARLPSTAQDLPGKGYAFEQNAKLGRGVNIIGYDPIWKDSSKARMQAKHFKLIKDAGFSNVRMVISPFKFSMDSAFTINPSCFTTFIWPIKHTLKNTLMSIVDFPYSTKPANSSLVE